MSLADALTFRTEPRQPAPVISQGSYDQDVEMEGDMEVKEEDEEEEEEEDMGDGDLFGDDAGGTPPRGAVGDDGLTSPERRQRKAMEYEEDEEEPQDQEVQLRDATVQIPNIPVPKSSDGNYWVIRMPHFIKLDSKPFHPDTYVGPDQEEDEQQAAPKEQSLSIKMEVENTIRWRWVKGTDGIDRKQSNSRIIRWSDGSLSLQLGKEIFDVNPNVDTSAASRSTLGGSSGTLSQSQSQASLTSHAPQSQASLRSQSLTYLVAQHKRAEVLQAEKVITGHLTIRPTDMQSETHRKLVRAVGQKHNKVARLKMAPSELVHRDPDKELAELAKSVARKPRKSGKKTDDSLVTPRRKRGSFGKKTRDQVWSDDDDEAAPSEEDTDDGLDGRRKLKKKPTGDDSKKGPGEYQTDDFVVSDEDDEDDEEGGKMKKKRPMHDEGEEEEKDILDEAEAKIAKQESKKRKKVTVKEEGSSQPKEEPEDEDDKMEVESEEDDDEEVGIRKAPPGGRRRRVAVDDDDEEE